MKENKFNFTKKALEDLSIPERGKRSYYYDLKVRGFGIAITDKGTKTFIVYRKIDGKPERVTLGKFPDLSIENARGLAFEVNSQIAKGKNPNQDKCKLRNELVLSELFKLYMERYSKIHKRSWQVDLDLYKYYLVVWEKRKISSIKKMDVESLHAKIGNNNGMYAANRAYALLHSLFNKAISWGWEGINPCIGVKKFKEKSRERFLQGDELPRFFEALNNEPNEIFKNFFYICLLTGARRRNVQAMHWNDINIERAEWYIRETKNGESQTIALSDEAIEILKFRFANKINEWVFPSVLNSSGHIKEPKRAWKRILIAAQIENLRIHDLRRTLGSWQAATGANSFIIGKSLGHKTQSATAIYARLNLDPVRESVKKATSAMFAAGLKIK